MPSSVGTERTLVIRHGTLIDGSGRAPVPNDALVVQGNRIRSIGRLPDSVRLDGSRSDVKDGLVVGLGDRVREPNPLAFTV